jgi:hypothetical protein
MLSDEDEIPVVDLGAHMKKKTNENPPVKKSIFDDRASIFAANSEEENSPIKPVEKKQAVKLVEKNAEPHKFIPENDEPEMKKAEQKEHPSQEKKQPLFIPEVDPSPEKPSPPKANERKRKVKDAPKPQEATIEEETPKKLLVEKENQPSSEDKRLIDLVHELEKEQLELKKKREKEDAEIAKRLQRELEEQEQQEDEEKKKVH